MADAIDSKSVPSNRVLVRVRPPAFITGQNLFRWGLSGFLFLTFVSIRDKRGHRI